ncbi:MAG: hypothetical protein U5K54_16840 [Cytophagales bacterium]|nr:hypothetical protein [Cytophagales bacterium]
MPPHRKKPEIAKAPSPNAGVDPEFSNSDGSMITYSRFFCRRRKQSLEKVMQKDIKNKYGATATIALLVLLRDKDAYDTTGNVPVPWTKLDYADIEKYAPENC